MERTIFAFILLILMVLIIADDIRIRLDFKRLQREINEYIKVTDEIIKFQTRLFDENSHKTWEDKFRQKQDWNMDW